MATGTQYTVVAAAPAMLIVDKEGHGEGRMAVVSNTGANPAQLGGPGVTASGYTLAAGATLDLQLADRDQLYAFSTAGTTLQVLTSP